MITIVDSCLAYSFYGEYVCLVIFFRRYLAYTYIQIIIKVLKDCKRETKEIYIYIYTSTEARISLYMNDRYRMSKHKRFKANNGTRG